jgi:hypothetical protein
VVLLGGLLPSALLAALWYLLPPGWRLLPVEAATAIELIVVQHNGTFGR